MEKAVLPTGFRDVLYEDASLQREVVNGLARSFESYGYQAVDPPVVEFETSLFSGTGKKLKHQTFRLMDPLSRKMVGLRADMTMQVARIAVSRLTKEPKPLRLSYAGPVLRVKSEDLYGERQLLQAGIELVGVDHARADSEVVLVIVNTLKAMKISGLYVDFTVPELSRVVLADMGFDKPLQEELLRALDRKDVTAIANLAADKAPLLVALAQPGITVADLRQLPLPDKAQALCDRLEEVMELVRCDAPDVALSIDPVESLKFNYHRGIGFSIFVKNVKEELGHGGRYVIDKKTDAVGFTLYVNELLRALPKPKAREKVFLPLGTSQKDASGLRDGGKVTLCSFSEDANDAGEARRLGCRYIFKDGALKEV